MTSVLGGKFFSGKYMPQVSAAGVASNFGTRTVGIQSLFYRAGNFLVKTGPAATGMKLTIRSIKRSIATSANISSLYKKIIVLAGKRRFCAFVYNYFFFFGC